MGAPVVAAACVCAADCYTRGMATGFAISVLALAVLVLSLAAMVTGVVMLVAEWRRGSGEDGMTCGRCGYSVRGVSTLSCPECGADLREVGITAVPKHRRVLPWVLIGVGLLVGTACFCGGLFGVRVQTAPPMTVPLSQPTVSPPAPASPNP